MDCDGCTLCCKLLDVPWMDSPAGELCKQCDEGKGCKIYDATSKDCKDFYCAYAQMEKVSINLRPDKCGVIFEKITDDIFIGTVDPNVIRLSDAARGQITLFIQEGFSVVLFNQKMEHPFIYPSNGHTADEVWKTTNMEASKINGISKLYNRSN